MELDKTFESRDEINRQVVAVLDEAGRTWGVKVLRYEIKNLTPPEAILRAMQAQITSEREKRALIAKSEGQRQEEINLADGEKQAAVLKSEGDKTAAINRAQGEAARIQLIAEATATAISSVAAALNAPGGKSGGEPGCGEAVCQCIRPPGAYQQHADCAGQRRRCCDTGQFGDGRDGQREKDDAGTGEYSPGSLISA